MATKRFDKRMNFLMTANEVQMLDELAKREGLSSSDVVRQLVRRRHAEAFGEPASKPAKRKRGK